MRKTRFAILRTFIFLSAGLLSANAFAQGALVIQNNMTNGTAVNELAKIITVGRDLGIENLAITNHNLDTSANCVVTSGAGTSGSATCQRQGLQQCVFDAGTLNGVRNGDCVKASDSVDGFCVDTRTMPPCDSDAVGTVASPTTSGPGTYAVNFNIMPPTGCITVKLTTTSQVALPAGTWTTFNTNIAKVTLPRWWSGVTVTVHGTFNWQNGATPPSALQVRAAIGAATDPHTVRAALIGGGMAEVAYPFVFEIIAPSPTAANPFLPPHGGTIVMQAFPTGQDVTAVNTGGDGDGSQFIATVCPQGE